MSKSENIIQLWVVNLFLFSLGRTPCQSQDSICSITNPHQAAEFPGGEWQMHCYIQENLNASIVRSVDTTGTAWAEIDVDTSGHVTFVKIVHSLEKELDDDLTRILCMMPQWTSGRTFGQPCSTKLRIPLTIPIRRNLCH
jgi:hypothetical protein